MPSSLKTTAQGSRNTASTSNTMKMQREDVEADVELDPGRALGVLAALVGGELLLAEARGPDHPPEDEVEGQEADDDDQERQDARVRGQETAAGSGARHQVPRFYRRRDSSRGRRRK